jgi:hypothetical protein
MVLYMAPFCIRIASYVDDRGTERNFVMLLEPVDLESSMWKRLGVGLIFGNRHFEGVEESVAIIM